MYGYQKKQTKLWIAAAVVCGLAGAGLLFISTVRGAGIGGDATIYITSARNLLAGKGLGLITAAGEFRLIPYFPPFYSLVLAFFGLFTNNLAGAAMILNLVLFAALIFLVTIWTMRVSESIFPALTLGLLLAGSPVLIPAYSWAMSEPLAVFLGFAGLILLEKALIEGTRFPLIASAVLLGLSFLTRYSSAAFIGAAVLLLFFFEGETLKERFRNAFLYGLIAMIPMIIWLVIDYTQTSTVASRSVLSGQMAELWAAFVPKIKQVFTFWLLPDSLAGNMPGFLKTVICVFMILFPLGTLAGSAVALRGRTDYPRYARMFFILSAFILLYDLLILVVSLTTYPPITINARMLLPVYIAEFWLFHLLFSLAGAYAQRPLQNVIFNFALFLFMLFSFFRGVRIARQNAIDGLGYHSVEWQESQTVAYVRENIGEDAVIVTNEETALLFLLDRASWPMHEVYVNEPDKEYYAYESDFGIENDASRQAFRKGNAYLVVFDTFEDQMADIYGDETQNRVAKLFENLDVLFKGDDGRIYVLSRTD